MHIELDLSGFQRLPGLPGRYEEGLDDVRSILGDVCDALAEDSAARFVVSGFGQERWPVDVRTDLAVFLGQLPDALASLESGASFSLDFYEQGIERAIHFEPGDGRYSARCESRTSWRPDPAVETVHRLELRKMLLNARSSMMDLLARAAPEVAAHPWIETWARTT